MIGEHVFESYSKAEVNLFQKIIAPDYWERSIRTDPETLKKIYVLSWTITDPIANQAAVEKMEKWKNGETVMLRKKVFISLPMNGRKEEEIRIDILNAENLYLEKENKRRQDVWFYNNLDGGKNALDFEREMAESEGANLITPEGDKMALWYLGIALTNLAYSDEAIFYGKWKEARGCQIEHEACIKYGIPVKYMQSM